MAFIDEMNIQLEAGRGGDGVVRWRQEKFKPLSGPGGGDGGNGGNVYARAVRDLSYLEYYRHKKIFKAEDGKPGQKSGRHGANGEHLYINVPRGSIIKNLHTEEVFELAEQGDEVLLLKGGRGGFGNEHFKASTNTTPYESTPGKDGEDAEFFIELQLFADAGLVGLPNAGKSSLLNAITNAQAKVGNYQFTTLEPNLGQFYGYVLADIPGLIEGASEGRGLGHKFLRHIKRTKLLVHLVSCENGDNMMDIYNEIRNELEKYDAGLANKNEIIVLSKIDMIEPAELEKQIAAFKKLGKPVYLLSLYDDATIDAFKQELSKHLES